MVQRINYLYVFLFIGLALARRLNCLQQVHNS